MRTTHEKHHIKTLVNTYFINIIYRIVFRGKSCIKRCERKRRKKTSDYNEAFNDKFLFFDSDVNSENIIGIEGGSAKLKNLISITFPEKSLPDRTKVALSTSRSSEIDYVFNETTFMFTGIKRLPQEIRISTGATPPSSEYIIGELYIGNIFDQLKTPSFSVLTSIEHGSSEETPTVIFNTLEYSYNEQEKKLTFKIPGAAFINNEITNMEYQAIVILAVNRPTKK